MPKQLFLFSSVFARSGPFRVTQRDRPDLHSLRFPYRQLSRAIFSLQAAHTMHSRLNIRDTSVWERATSFTCRDRILMMGWQEKATRFLAVSIAFGVGIQFGFIYFYIALAFMAAVQKIRAMSSSVRDPVVPRAVTINFFTIASAREMLGFNINELRDMIVNELNWPANIHVDSGGNDLSKDYSMDGEKAFLYMLFRHKTDNKLTTHESFWGFSYCTGSRVLEASEKFFVDMHVHRLTSIAFFQLRFPL